MRPARLLPRLAILSLLALPSAYAQLRPRIAAIAAQAHGRVAVACSLPGQNLDCDFHAADALPMQSVYKLPIAIAVLHAVEEGRLSLAQTLHLVPSAMIAPTGYSPLRDEHPHGSVDLSVEELLRRAIVQSDNVASDAVLRAIGGPAAATACIRGFGFSAIHIVDYEGVLDRDEQLQYRNSAAPRALVALLDRLASRSPLSPEHTRLLLGWMSASATGNHRLRALLPPGTPIADKTGSSGLTRPTLNAVNDVGLITLPDGRKLAVAVLIADSSAPLEMREQVIAQIARAVWDAATQPASASR